VFVDGPRRRARGCRPRTGHEARRHAEPPAVRERANERWPGWCATSSSSARAVFGGPIALVRLHAGATSSRSAAGVTEAEFPAGSSRVGQTSARAAGRAGRHVARLPAAGTRGAGRGLHPVRAAAVLVRRRRSGPVRRVPRLAWGASNIFRGVGPAVLAHHRDRRVQASPRLDQQVRPDPVLVAGDPLRRHGQSPAPRSSGCSSLPVPSARSTTAAASRAARRTSAPSRRTGALAAVKGLAWTGAGSLAGPDVALFFAKAGAFTFRVGTGHRAVPAPGPCRRPSLADRAAVRSTRSRWGLISPGPVVIMATFAGYLIFASVGAVRRHGRRCSSRPTSSSSSRGGPDPPVTSTTRVCRGSSRGATAAAAGAIRAGAAIVIAEQGHHCSVVGRDRRAPR